MTTADAPTRPRARARDRAPAPRVSEHLARALPPGWSGARGPTPGRDDVHLWYLLTDDARAHRDAAGRAASWLAPHERAQYESFRREPDRHRYLVTRALVRAALSSHADVPAQAWRFGVGAHGRPEVAWPDANLRFNVSHTDGVTACIVARDRDVGVDVERVTPGLPITAMADLALAPREHAALALLPPAERERHFFAVWTLKEAFIKADGRGLLLPPRGFAVAPAAGAAAGPASLWAPAGAAPSAEWTLLGRWPTADHAVGVCISQPRTRRGVAAGPTSCDDSHD